MPPEKPINAKAANAIPLLEGSAAAIIPAFIVALRPYEDMPKIRQNIIVISYAPSNERPIAPANIADKNATP